MKNPVLRVKKGQKSYDDLARESAAPEGEQGGSRLREVPRRRGSFLRMRRGSLFPIVVLVVIAVVLLRVMPRSAARANIAGWHAVLEARVSGNHLDVGVAFSRLDRGTETGAPQEVSVVFVLPERGERIEILGVLSAPRVALRSRMTHETSDTLLRAVVTIGGVSRTLSLPLNNPVAIP